MRIEERDLRLARDLAEKFCRSNDAHSAPRMQHQQIVIAADQDICLRYRRQCQELVVPEVAAGRIYICQICILNDEEARCAIDQCDKREGRLPGPVSIEFITAQHLCHFGQSFCAGAHVAVAHRFCQCLIGNRACAERCAHQRARIENNPENSAHLPEPRFVHHPGHILIRQFGSGSGLFCSHALFSFSPPSL